MQFIKKEGIISKSPILSRNTHVKKMAGQLTARWKKAAKKGKIHKIGGKVADK